MTGGNPRSLALARAASELARASFTTNLRLGYVGGSYATGRARPDSDVDVFVVLHQPDRPAERRFAERLKAFHERAGLRFEHCGELFDEQTLDQLLGMTERLAARLPALHHLACYQADCLLSVFRKGDVVFKFLADPKTCVVGDAVYLAALERRARRYFARFPMRRVQQYKDQLTLPAGTPEAALLRRFKARLAGPGWADTPVGIGLERWFRREPAASLLGGDPLSLHLDQRLRWTCPLPTLPAGQATAVVRWQCLAHQGGDPR